MSIFSQNITNPSAITLNQNQVIVAGAIKLRRWGDLSKPLILIMGGISANRYVNDHEGQKGWWSAMCESGSVFNEFDFQYLAFEYYTHPERVTNPPVITPEDQAGIIAQVHAQLSLPSFYAVVGSSYGGLVALALAANHPGLTEQLIVIGAADEQRVKVQATRDVQRQIIELSLSCGDLIDPRKFISLARSLAMIGYRGEAEWESRFKTEQSTNGPAVLSAVSGYLTHQGDKFAAGFAPSRYLQLSKSIDHCDVNVSTIRCKTLLLGFDSDEIAPPQMLTKMVDRFQITPQLQIIPSVFGHDAFLLEAKAINPIIKNFFAEYRHEKLEPNQRSACGY